MNGCCYRAEMTSVTGGLATGNHTYGLGLISRHQPDSGGPYDFYYHYDGLGSTWAMTDLSGALAGRYSYDAWGIAEVRYQSGLVDNRFRYVGELGYYDDWNSAGLSLLGARYYKPSIGRFISADPIGYEGGDLNLYGYAANRPTRLVDPEGEAWWYWCFVNPVACVTAYLIHRTQPKPKPKPEPYVPACCKDLLQNTAAGGRRDQPLWIGKCQDCCDAIVALFLPEVKRDCYDDCNRLWIPKEVFMLWPKGAKPYENYQFHD